MLTKQRWVPPRRPRLLNATQRLDNPETLKQVVFESAALRESVKKIADAQESC